MCKTGRKDRDVCQTVIMLLLLPVASATTCQQLQCLNSNPCQSHLTPDNTTHAQCLCGGKWAGPRCQYHLHLQTETVTSSSVTLTVDLMTSQKQETKTNPSWKETEKLPRSEEKLWLNYTLVYWRKTKRDTSSNASSPSFQPSEKTSCVILHRQTSQHRTLQGLYPQVLYAVCIESGFRDSCILSSITGPFSPSAQIPPSWDSSSSSWPMNCVVFVTPNGRETVEDVSSLIVGAVSVVVVCVVCIVSISVFLIRGHYSVARRFFTGPICQRRWRSRTYGYNSPEDWACMNPSDSQQETSALVDRTETHHMSDQRL